MERHRLYRPDAERLVAGPDAAARSPDALGGRSGGRALAHLLHARGADDEGGAADVAARPECGAVVGLDFPVVAGPTDCTVAPGPPRARVRLRDASGARREVTLPLEDGGLARRLHDGDCAEQALLSQAAIQVVSIRPATARRARRCG